LHSEKVVKQFGRVGVAFGQGFITQVQKWQSCFPTKQITRKQRGKRTDSTEKQSTFNVGGAYPIGRPLTARGGNLRTQLNFFGLGFVTNAALETFSSQNFALTSFADYATYTALFDQYRIVHAEMWFIPSANIGTSSIPEVGAYCTAVDIDDVAVAGSFQALTSKPDSNISGMFAGHYHSFKPAIAVAAYSGAFTSYASVDTPWLDSASPSILYYGVKTAATVASTAIVVNLRIRVIAEFRGVKV
jgi:hypothetical protein